MEPFNGDSSSGVPSYNIYKENLLSFCLKCNNSNRNNNVFLYVIKIIIRRDITEVQVQIRLYFNIMSFNHLFSITARHQNFVNLGMRAGK